MGDFWERDSAWKPVDGHGIADRVGGGDPCFVAAIVFKCGADVVSFYTMGGKSAALRWSFMDKDFGSRDSEWSFVEVEVSEEAGVGRESWLASGCSQVI